MQAKYILPRAIAAAAIAAGFAGAPAYGAAASPAKGIFSALDYVASASGSDCKVKTGDLFSGHLVWPGAGKPGAVWRYQLAGPEGAEVKALTYPKTPAATSTKWAGTVKVLYEPSGATGQSTLDGTITYINAVSFVLQATYTFGNCTQTIFSSLVAE